MSEGNYSSQKYIPIEVQTGTYPHYGLRAEIEDWDGWRRGKDLVERKLEAQKSLLARSKAKIRVKERMREVCNEKLHFMGKKYDNIVDGEFGALSDEELARRTAIKVARKQISDEMKAVHVTHSNSYDVVVLAHKASDNREIKKKVITDAETTAELGTPSTIFPPETLLSSALIITLMLILMSTLYVEQ